MRTPVIEDVYRDEGHEEAEAPQCRHHWVIESPHGATSMGRCKICDEVREFRNSAADTVWEGDPMSSISKMGGGGGPVVRETASIQREE
jgi:hypothetical protein